MTGIEPRKNIPQVITQEFSQGVIVLIFGDSGF